MNTPKTDAIKHRYAKTRIIALVWDEVAQLEKDNQRLEARLALLEAARSLWEADKGGNTNE